MFYVSPLDCCIYWLSVKYSLALIILQIALVSQTYSDQCTLSLLSFVTGISGHILTLSIKVSLLQMAEQKFTKKSKQRRSWLYLIQLQTFEMLSIHDSCSTGDAVH